MNQKNSFYICFIAFSLLSMSCNHFKSKNDDTMVFDIKVRESIYSDTIKIPLSSLSKCIKYIPLETKPNCLISNITDVQLTEDYIFLSDNQSVLQFDYKGRFVNAIGSPGKGPGEHGPFIRFTLLKQRNEIHILSYNNLMNVYDLKTGLYIRNYKINMPVSRFFGSKSDRIVFFTKSINSMTSISSVNEVYITDSNGIILDSIPDFSRLDNRSNMVGFTNFFAKDDQIFYLGNFKDTIYHLSNYNNRIPYAITNLKNSIQPDKIIIEPIMGKHLYPDLLSVIAFFERNDYLFLTIQKGFSIGMPSVLVNILYDKNSRKCSTTRNFTNDLDNGPNIWPKFVIDKKMISDFTPASIVDYYNRNKTSKLFSNEFIELAKNIKLEDNSVLVIVE
jgi:hypothetical protein